MSCRVCNGFLWVCEAHPEKVWDLSAGGCECSAGMPCECNPTGAIGESMAEIIIDVTMPEPRAKMTIQ